MNSLENQFECQLDGTRTTNLIERIETSGAKASARQALGEGLRRQTEPADAELDVRRSKVWMIQDIEHFCAKLQFGPLSDRKRPMDRKVPLCGTKASQRIPAERALPDRIAGYRIDWGIDKRSRIERFPPWKLWTVKIEWLPLDHVRADIRIDSAVQELKIHVRNVNGRSGARQYKALE